MGVKKFIETVKEFLELNGFKKAGKKQSIKKLLKKLNLKKEKIEKALTKKVDKKEKKAMEEELEIICFQIKKGKKILDKLD